MRAGEGIAAVLRAEREAIPDALNRQVVEFTNEVKILVSRHGSHPYWSYRLPGHRRSENRHVQLGSLPDEPPAVDTGDYRASWRFSPAKRVARGQQATSFTSEELGVWLEFGTRHMKPRPHARVVAAAKHATIPVAMELALSVAGHRRAAEMGGH